MSYSYSHDYFPPAPVVSITLIAPAERLRTNTLSALVDSGADGTLVPVDYLNEIHASPTTERFVRSQWGERRSVLMYLVDVQVGALTLPGIEVVGDDMSQEVILGRDVLNRLRVLLDGPRETVSVHE